MKRLICSVGLGLVLLTGSAAAGTPRIFAVVPSESAALPSAETPNASGTLSLPPAFESRPSRPVALSYPELQALWERAGAAYGIPWSLLAAINDIESNFGRNMGPSSAGAVGWMQFMPETWLRWGLDADGDGLADPWNPYDAIYAAARYLAAAGGETDLARAVFAYNHADWYVDQVLALARVYAQGGASATLSLDGVDGRLGEIEQSVGEAQAELSRARAVEVELERKAERLFARAAAVPILSDRLALEKKAYGLYARLDAARAAAERASARLDDAHGALASGRERTLLATFDPSAAALLGAPTSSGDAVFPVGGGPELVSASHTHHDYPAVDIAAPHGSPIYAHVASRVIAAWPTPSGRCGIGMTIEARDGRRWTYCHFGFLEPNVRAGASLAAGDGVGTVGSTGRSTGPHLHLQLSPASSYPQSEPWFESFAGVAFRWSDAAAPGTGAGPVFVVLPSEPPPEEGVLLFSAP